MVFIIGHLVCFKVYFRHIAILDDTIRIEKLDKLAVLTSIQWKPLECMKFCFENWRIYEPFLGDGCSDTNRKLHIFLRIPGLKVLYNRTQKSKTTHYFWGFCFFQPNLFKMMNLPFLFYINHDNGVVWLGMITEWVCWLSHFHSVSKNLFLSLPSHLMGMDFFCIISILIG